MATITEEQDQVDCAKVVNDKLPPKSPPPDLVNCAEKSIFLAKQNNCIGLFGDPVSKGSTKNSLIKSTSPLERLNFFNSGNETKTRKKSEPIKKIMRPKFVKSASIARLLGNNYSTSNVVLQSGPTSRNTDQSTSVEDNNNNKSDQKGITNQSSSVNSCNSVVSVRKLEKFHKCSDKELSENDLKEQQGSFSASTTTLNCDEVGGGVSEKQNSDLSLRALRSFSKGLGKLLRRRTDSVEISPPDPEYKVTYLGNVLTGMAKGEGCFEKPLSTLWKNYTQNNKPDVMMRIRVSPSGLKATTKQHGLTEYWSHRITYCSAPKNYPRIFCWIYRHEGRRLKHELRCHAVLCSKEVISREISNQLQENLFRALKEFKRDKISRQNARLSLANSVYDNPSLPRRKLMLSVGGNNYRPPLERSKSAPKLMAIEEAIGEEDEEDIEEVEDEKSGGRSGRYPAMTLGRRSWMLKNKEIVEEEPEDEARLEEEICELDREKSFKLSPSTSHYEDESDERDEEEESAARSTGRGLEGEIMSYFEKKLSEKSVSMELNGRLMSEEKMESKLRNLSLDCLFDQDEVISQIIRSRTPTLIDEFNMTGGGLKKSEPFDRERNNLTPGAASESDEPELSFRIIKEHVPKLILSSDENSDESLVSSIMDNEEHDLKTKGGHLTSQFSHDSELEMDLKRLPSTEEFFNNLTALDSDSDVSDESGFIEYQQESLNKFEVEANHSPKPIKSILV